MSFLGAPEGGSPSYNPRRVNIRTGVGEQPVRAKESKPIVVEGIDYKTVLSLEAVLSKVKSIKVSTIIEGFGARFPSLDEQSINDELSNVLAEILKSIAPEHIFYCRTIS